MHMQPLYADVQITGGQGAQAHFERGICLPSGSSMSEDDQSRVIRALRSLLTTDAVVDLGEQIDITDEQAQQHQGSRAPMS